MIQNYSSAMVPKDCHKHSEEKVAENTNERRSASKVSQKKRNETEEIRT
jgi:hypothetical protein